MWAAKSSRRPSRATRAGTPSRCAAPFGPRRSFDERPSREAQEYVFQRRTPDDSTLERNAARMDLLQRVLAVRRIYLHAIGQHLHAVTNADELFLDCLPRRSGWGLAARRRVCVIRK